MTLELRGQRAKRDGKGVIEALDIIVRDDVGERPIEAYSGGETTSVCLANAVALSRLAAHRSGQPIELLVIDEPEGLDDHARSALVHLLRGMTNAGKLGLVVLITHYADLAEGLADTVWSVSKNGAGSVVTEAA
jgi:exonuclease SbcC